MSFISDLKFGKENEKYVLSVVQELYPLDEWSFSEEKTAVDIVSSKGMTIECKSDRLSLTTGNVFIEISCSGKPSGIYKYDVLHALSYSYGPTTLLINVSKLKSFIEENKTRLRKIKGGDGWRTEGYLIKLAEFEQLASIIITND